MKLVDYVNRHIQEIPPEVESWAGQTHYNNPCYCSLVKRDCGQIYEAIYGVKRIKNRTYIQLLAIDTEKSGRFVRNCYYSWYGMASGFHSYGYTGKAKSLGYYGEMDYESVLGEAKDYFDTDKIHRECINATELSTLEPNLRYCAYKQLFVEPITYLRIYRKFPKQAEMLMKFNLTKMLSENNCKKLSENPLFHRWLERHHEQCKWMAYQTAFNSFKKNPETDPRDYENSLAYRIQCGRELGVENKAVYAKMLKYTTQEKLVKWMDENRISSRTYNDYIRACDWLKKDFSDTKVLFPRNFQEVHDLYTKQYGAWKAEQARLAEIERQRRIAKQKKEERERAKSLGENLKEMADRFSFLAKTGDDYLVKVARSKLDLIDEGSALNICVGYMGYDERMAEGKSIICFIRRTTEPDVPFVCAEVKVGATLKLVQCNGEKNKNVPEVKKFTDEWMEYANRRYKDAV